MSPPNYDNHHHPSHSPCRPGGSEPLTPSWEPGGQGRSLLAAAWWCTLMCDPPAPTWGSPDGTRSPSGRLPETPGSLHRVRQGWGSPVHHQGRQGARRHHARETGPRRHPAAGTPGRSSTARSDGGERCREVERGKGTNTKLNNCLRAERLPLYSL